MRHSPKPNNVVGIHHTVCVIVQPQTVEDVLAALALARKNEEKLYPISTGLNWGYGSDSPVVPGCKLLDLRRMNRILNAGEISVDNPVAIIEPGVTQGQLYDFLQKHCPELTFNVSGAGRDTSIIGNALDRGVGYFGPRKDDLFGLEVVTGTGRVLRTGFRRLGDQSPLASSHPFGLGPILDGLFFQSNFGIVTSACFRLMPRRPKEVAVSLALRRETDLPLFIDELARLKREGLLTSVTHIANQARTHSSLSYGVHKYFSDVCGLGVEAATREAATAIRIVAPDEWTSLAAITGNPGQVRAAIREVRKRTGSIARMMVVSRHLLNFGYSVTNRLRFIPFARANAAAIAAIGPLHDLALGVPTDVAIQNLLWKFNHSSDAAIELDASRCGLMFVSPALPLNGALASEVMRDMNKIAERHGHTLYITLNIETETSLVAVTNLLFDRGVEGETERAHVCADELLSYIRSRGLEIYRARADMMGAVTEADPEYWQLISRLKDVFDPDRIIAPGRYNIAD